MGMGAIAWACLLLTVHQGPPEEVFLDGRHFQIPVKIEPRRRNDLVELTLFVSRDQGTSWNVVEKKPPTEKAFVYRAPSDGSYWFVVQEEDRAHKLNPADPIAARPSLRVVVDTVKPQVKVTSAERLPNGEVLVRWKITEENPDPRSLRLDYHTPAMKPDQWTPLVVDSPSGSGEKRFNPASAGEIRVRVQIKDRAENVGQDEAVVTDANGAAAPVNGGTPTIGVIPTNRTEKPQPAFLANRQTVRPPEDQQSPNHAGTGGPIVPLLAPAETNPAPRTPSAAPPFADKSSPPASGASFAPETPHGALPSLQIVSKREVKLEFEVAKVGPSGLGGANVYITQNEGATWERWPGELPVNLSGDAAGRGSGPVRGSVTVQLAREAIPYGFIVAVKSKAGLARPAPKPGEPPQIRVELDATAPKAALFEPLPDRNQPDSLILSWNAVDRNLASNPVRLEWAERKEGPWSSIGGEALPNTGQYSWHLPDRAPSRVYLKLTVRDTAGNVAIAQTPTPVLIDLTVPETNIIGVAPTSR